MPETPQPGHQDRMRDSRLLRRFRVLCKYLAKAIAINVNRDPDRHPAGRVDGWGLGGIRGIDNPL